MNRTSHFNPEKLNFKESAPSHNGRILLCPECGESLVQADIENFSACPYCDHHFEVDSELEDYLLEPVIKTWIHQQNVEEAMSLNVDSFFEDESPEQSKKKF